MTLHQLPPATAASLTPNERLDRIEARIDVLIDGIRELLTEVVALRERFDRDH